MTNKTKELPLDEEQQKAYDIALGGDNLFLTGDAGTGKSFVLNRIIKGLEKDPRLTVLVCAPTGIAALNIGGTTIYSLLGIRPQTDLLNAPSNRVSGHVMDKLDEHTVIVVDEVSMFRADLFDFFINAVKKAQRAKADQERDHGNLDWDGTVQYIFSGDFYQLPPVITPSDRPQLEQKYPYSDPYYIFSSTSWPTLDLKNVILHQIHRQENDQQLANALDQIRINGKSSYNALRYINAESRREPIYNAVTLCGKNKTANKINEHNLNKLESPVYTFEAHIETKDDTNVEITDPVPRLLFLKEGARVMLQKNGSYLPPNKRGKGFDPDLDKIEYYNGDLGTILKIKANAQNVCQPTHRNENGFHDYKNDDVSVVIKLDRTDEIIQVSWQEWDFYEYRRVKNNENVDSEFDNSNEDDLPPAKKHLIEKLKAESTSDFNKDTDEVPVDDGLHHNIKTSKLEKAVVGEFHQLPLRLAYAITIHKSQGQTYNAVNFMPEIFAPGQLYVGLSRVKSLSGLHLMQTLTPGMIINNPMVNRFYYNLGIREKGMFYDEVLRACFNQERWGVLNYLATCNDKNYQNIMNIINQGLAKQNQGKTKDSQ